MEGPSKLTGEKNKNKLFFNSIANVFTSLPYPNWNQIEFAFEVMQISEVKMSEQRIFDALPFAISIQWCDVIK